MELNSFIHEEKSVKITGIKVGEWFITSRFGEPYLVYECASVTEDGHGVVQAKSAGPRVYISAWHCYKLDPSYTPEQLHVLQARAIKEYQQYRREHQAGAQVAGKSVVGNMDHLKDKK